MRKHNRGTLLTLLTLGALLVVFGTAGPANADQPHADPSFMIPDGVCGFPVQLQIPADGERATTVTRDGTSVTTVHGTFKETFVNTVTGKTVSVTASGPGTVTQTGSVQQIDGRGTGTVYVTNGSQFGLPNLFLYAGPIGFTTDTSNDTLLSVSQYPHVKTDLCAALS